MLPDYLKEANAKEDAALKALTDFLDNELSRVQEMEKRYKRINQRTQNTRNQNASI